MNPIKSMLAGTMQTRYAAIHLVLAARSAAHWGWLDYCAFARISQPTARKHFETAARNGWGDYTWGTMIFNSKFTQIARRVDLDAPNPFFGDFGSEP